MFLIFHPKFFLNFIVLEMSITCFLEWWLVKFDNIEGAIFFKKDSWGNQDQIVFEMVFSKVDNVGGQSHVSKICLRLRH